MLKTALVLVAAVAGAAADDPQLQCAACGLVTNWLAHVRKTTADELAVSKEHADKRKESIDRVQKAQTKRWLKMEYGAALSSAVEEELEVVCTRDKLTSSKALKAACNELIETQYEALPRAILDQNEDWCGEVHEGCSGSVMKEAVEEYSPRLRSEERPKKSAQFVGPGKAVTKLVGTTLGKTVNRRDKHTLVMLFTSEHDPAGSTPPAKYQAAAAAFYALALAANRSKAVPIPVRFAQMDLRLNSAPGWLELAAPHGLQLLLWLKGDKEKHPEMLPQHGEPGLADANQAHVQQRLMQILFQHLKGSEMQALRKGVEQLEPAADATGATAGESKAHRMQAAAGRAKRKNSDAAPKASLRRAQECEMCGIISLQLHEALEEQKKELELSHEANTKKQQHIEKVQKAQTKRWLKQEYGAALAAALEERIDGMCTSAKFKAFACDKSMVDVVSSTLLKPDERDFTLAACELRVRERCDDMLHEHAEGLMRAVLDGKDAGVCTGLVRKCGEANAQIFNASRRFHIKGASLEEAVEKAEAAAAAEAAAKDGAQRDEL